jgi:hypothetical protein
LTIPAGDRVKGASQNETIPFFDEFDRLGLYRPCLAGHVLVTVQDDLSVERGMAAHADCNMSPVRIHDVKVVMIDIRPRFFSRNIANLPFPRLLHMPHDSRGATDQNKEQAGFGRMLGEEFLGRQVLPLAAPAIDYWHAIGFGPGTKPAAEASRHAHQVFVVELLIGPVQRLPPVPKTSAVAATREPRVNHHPIHAIVLSFEKFRVSAGELV